mgnify:CR=1 FL=1
MVGEQITAQGVGNGISLIIFAGIVAALPKNLGTLYHYVQAGTISYFSVFMFGVIALAMVMFVVYIEMASAVFPSPMPREWSVSVPMVVIPATSP